jgi:hypothetical protein
MHALHMLASDMLAWCYMHTVHVLQALRFDLVVAGVICLVQERILLPVLQVVKLGEGTCGEAFKSGGVVFKLVPMEGGNLINGWPQKGAGDLLGEAVIAITLSGLAEEADAAGEAVVLMHSVCLTQKM